MQAPGVLRGNNVGCLQQLDEPAGGIAYVPDGSGSQHYPAYAIGQGRKRLRLKGLRRVSNGGFIRGAQLFSHPTSLMPPLGLSGSSRRQKVAWAE
ncbi:hypothetical protein GCM10027038_36490 [Arthrobacter bambusae]